MFHIWHIIQSIVLTFLNNTRLYYVETPFVEGIPTTVLATKTTYLKVFKVFKLNVNYIDGLSNNIENTKTFVTSYLWERRHS